MQSKPQQPSNKHHYVPEFLLKQWADTKGDIWRHFRNGRGEIDCKRQAPGGMGYYPGLYATDGLPPEHRQQVEKLFMMPLDTAANRIHQRLLKGQVEKLTDAQRSRWASLIMSLWFRTPGEVASIRDAIEAFYDRHLITSAETVDGPVRLPEVARNQLAMEVLMKLIDDGERGGELINMHWGIIEVDRSREFFLSDAPLSHPTSFARLGGAGSYVTLPIAPTKLFIAANSPTLIETMKSLPQRELVARQNHAAVGQAAHFVGSTGRNADKFIRETFGSTTATSLTRHIAENVVPKRKGHDALVQMADPAS